jgi:hypothetical protein
MQQDDKWGKPKRQTGSQEIATATECSRRMSPWGPIPEVGLGSRRVCFTPMTGHRQFYRLSSKTAASGKLDCFVAEPVNGRAFARPVGSRNDETHQMRTDLPDGQISSSVDFLSSPSCKNISLLSRPKSLH